MSNVTGQQVLEAMKSANITEVDHHDCGICGAMVFYLREGDDMYFNSGCGCSWSPPRQCSWEEVADWINRQTEDWKAKLKARFGFKEPEHESD